MRQIETDFMYDGFHHVQIDRHEDIACYRKRRPNGRYDGYEVVIIQKLPACTMPNGTELPAREGYPKSEDWGFSGWSLPSRSSAYAKMALLEKGSIKNGRLVRE